MKHAAKFLILVILTEILSGCTRPPPFSLISPIHDKRHWKCKIIHDVDVKALKAKEKRATIPHASATKSFHRVDLTPFGVLKQKIHKCKHDGCNWDWIPRKKKASKLGLVEVFRIDIIKVARIGTEVCSRGSEQKISPAWGSWGDDGWEKVLIHETQIYKSNPDDPYNTFWIDVEWALKDKINKMVDKAGRRIWKYREVNSKFLHLETKEGLPVAMVEYGLDYRTGNEYLLVSYNGYLYEIQGNNSSRMFADTHLIKAIAKTIGFREFVILTPGQNITDFATLVIRKDPQITFKGALGGSVHRFNVK